MPHLPKLSDHDCITLPIYRHPSPSSRPSFQDILTALQKDEQEVLEIPTDAAQSHSSATVLGASLGAGAAMYQDLHLQYSRYSPTADEDSMVL